MIVSSLTSSKIPNLNSTRLRPNTRLSQKQSEHIHEFTMVYQICNRYIHIHAVMNNLKFIILDYLAAKKSGILD